MERIIEKHGARFSVLAKMIIPPIRNPKILQELLVKLNLAGNQLRFKKLIFTVSKLKADKP